MNKSNSEHGFCFGLSGGSSAFLTEVLGNHGAEDVDPLPLVVVVAIVVIVVVLLLVVVVLLLLEVLLLLLLLLLLLVPLSDSSLPPPVKKSKTLTKGAFVKIYAFNRTVSITSSNVTGKALARGTRI